MNAQPAPETYERLTVNLTRRAYLARKLAAELTGDTETDVVNRALQAYAYLEYITSPDRGGEVAVRESPGADWMRLRLRCADDEDEGDSFPVACENGCPEGWLGVHKFSCALARPAEAD